METAGTFTLTPMVITLLGTIFGLLILWMATAKAITLFKQLRVVVSPDEVHIISDKNEVRSYGKGKPKGNVYWFFPEWVPIIGRTRKALPVSNFDLNLSGYPTYDQDRLPFMVDITAFFRIIDTNLAAERVSGFEELQSQLLNIVQGAVRAILASHTIDDIMLQRDTFGIAFTDAVRKEMVNWGCEAVKNLELMDIRDADGSNVIANIMNKKKSEVEKDSRVEVAENKRIASEAEITAQQSVDLKAVDAERLVGERRAEQTRAVGVADEQANQEIQEQRAITTEKEKQVLQVGTIRDAEIAQEQAEINDREAEFRAAAVVKEGTAKADVRKLELAADDALEIRLNTQKEMTIGVAEALGKAQLVPEVYFAAGGADGDQPSDATKMLERIMTMSLGVNLKKSLEADTSGDSGKAAA